MELKRTVFLLGVGCSMPYASMENRIGKNRELLVDAGVPDALIILTKLK